MTESNPHDPHSSLSSAEYRAKLLTKLNCLIAVLEVAIAKIARSLDLPGANEERLMKIRTNLENTLAICRRAKDTLVRGMEASTTTSSVPATRRGERMSYRDYVELSSIEEYQKFKTLPPIEKKDIESLDIDELMKKFDDS